MVSASSPACTLGCNVLTLPSNDSGNPVTSSTGVTGTPASAITFAVPPVETISTPAACRPVASSNRPLLSDTPINARRTGRCPGTGVRSLAEPHLPSVHRAPHTGQFRDDVHEQPALHGLDVLVQRLLVVLGLHDHGLLRDDRPRVHPRIHEMHGRPGHLGPELQSVGHGPDTRERGQQCRMSVDHPVGKTGQELRPEDLEETCGHHEIGSMSGDGLGEGLVPRRPVGIVTRLDDERRHARPLGPLQGLDLLAVGPYRHDLGGETVVPHRVEHGLQQGSRAGGEYDELHRDGQLQTDSQWGLLAGPYADGAHID